MEEAVKLIAESGANIFTNLTKDGYYDLKNQTVGIQKILIVDYKDITNNEHLHIGRIDHVIHL